MTLLPPGELVDGRYRIESFIGGGGMASVYRATHVVLEQTVAIKVISPTIRLVPGMAQRFLREARAATHLKSEHVARVSDVGTMADGAPFIVMEYLDGHDLDALVDSNEPTPVDDCVEYVLQACEALAEVHGLGIVHRDLKPANLFLTRGADGLPCVKLIDFGISRTDAPLDGKEAVAITQPDAVMGSPRYMSPEAMESSSKADARSDIYGIGAVLYELLTKNAPHEGETFLDIYAAATLLPPAAPSSLRSEIPHALDGVILKCLQVDPADRYADAAALAAALAPFGPEGSLARAAGIARVLEAARSRAADGGASESTIMRRDGSGSSSNVRRRGRSAHTVRRERIVRMSLVGALLAMVGLAFGGRALYVRGEANGIASASTATSGPSVPSAPVENAGSLAAAGPNGAAPRPASAANEATTVAVPMVTTPVPAKPEGSLAAAGAAGTTTITAVTLTATEPDVTADSARSHLAFAAPDATATGTTTTTPSVTTTAPALRVQTPARAWRNSAAADDKLFEDRK